MEKRLTVLPCGRISDGERKAKAREKYARRMAKLGKTVTPRPKLTPEERAEWAKWKAKHDAEYRKKQLGIALDAVTSTMDAAAAALRESVAAPDDPAAIWAAIEALSAALENAGFDKPKRPRGRPRIIEVDEYIDDDTWPRGDRPPLP